MTRKEAEEIVDKLVFEYQTTDKSFSKIFPKPLAKFYENMHESVIETDIREEEIARQKLIDYYLIMQTPLFKALEEVDEN